jgi:predicted nucleic acid-binding protein
MQYLVDTGVLLRLFDTSDPEHQNIVSLVRLLRSRGDELISTAQNIAEFWNVSTRPAAARGGYGQSVAATDRRVRFLERLGRVLLPDPAEYAHWRDLLVTHAISGVSVHDARLVAAMQVAGITHLISLNASDFQRYPDVETLTPAELLASIGEVDD